MSETSRLFERQGAWQKQRAKLTWPEEVRMAETVRRSVTEFRQPQQAVATARMLTLFLDDSSDSRQQKVTVYAGFLSDTDNWAKLRQLWSKKLKERNICYFRWTECKSLTGEFKRFRSNANYPKPKGRDAAESIRDELQDIIEQCGVAGFAVGVLVQDYKEVLKMSEARGRLNRSPDETAFQSVIFECAKRVRNELPGGHKVDVVCDDSNKAAKLSKIYQKFKQKNPRTAAVIGCFRSEDDKETPGLQAADLMAGLSKDWLLKKIKDGSQPKKGELIGSVQLMGYWDENYTLSGLKDVIHAELERVCSRNGATARCAKLQAEIEAVERAIGRQQEGKTL